MSIRGLHRVSVLQGWTAVVLLAGLVVAARTGSRAEPQGLPADTAAVERPECPHDSLIVKLISEKGRFLRLVNSIPLSDPISDVPEFHDCQRFVRRISFLQWLLGGRPRERYDSLYAIFAAFKLDTLPAALEGNGVPVATIYSYGGTYEPLGIKPGFNCLVLSGTPGAWVAKMLPQANSADSSCEGMHIDESAPGTPLTVFETPAPPVGDHVPFDSTNYPPVARWDWDGVNQYIGIACGTTWCEIGPPGFSPSPIYQGPDIQFDDIPVLAATVTQRRQVTRIKGWYDDQQLDRAGPEGRHIVTGVRGWLFPNPELEDGLLDRPQSVAALRGVWVHVATAFLNGNYKANLRRGANKIYMCHESAGQLGSCKMPAAAGSSSLAIQMAQLPVSPPFTRPLNACDVDPTDGLKRWWRIQPEAGPALYVCVKRRDHYSDLEHYRAQHQNVRVWIPATARWRWLLDDAGAWHKCETGCCTGQ